MEEMRAKLNIMEEKADVGKGAGKGPEERRRAIAEWSAGVERAGKAREGNLGEKGGGR